MRRLSLILALTIVLSLTVGCATGTRAGSRSPSGDRNLISQVELGTLVATTVLEAIQELRPRWLISRGVFSFDKPMGEVPLVFIDNVQAGEIDILLTMSVEDVVEIRYHDAADATTRWGTGMVGGVIHVITVK